MRFPPTDETSLQASIFLHKRLDWGMKPHPDAFVLVGKAYPTQENHLPPNDNDTNAQTKNLSSLANRCFVILHQTLQTPPYFEAPPQAIVYDHQSRQTSQQSSDHLKISPPISKAIEVRVSAWPHRLWPHQSVST